MIQTTSTVDPPVQGFRHDQQINHGVLPTLDPHQTQKKREREKTWRDSDLPAEYSESTYLIDESEAQIKAISQSIEQEVDSLEGCIVARLSNTDYYESEIRALGVHTSTLLPRRGPMRE